MVSFLKPFLLLSFFLTSFPRVSMVKDRNNKLECTINLDGERSKWTEESFRNSLPVFVTKGKNTLHIYAESSEKGQYQKIIILLSNFKGIGTYTTENGSKILLLHNEEWHRSRNQNGRINILNYDRNKEVLQGAFELQTRNNEGKQLNVKNGTFSLTL